MEKTPDPFSRTVELYLIDADGKPQQRGSETVAVAPGERSKSSSA